MSLPPTEHAVRPASAAAPDRGSRRSTDGRLSPVQVLAGALAAVSAAVVASLFGVAGTVLGAALASVVSTVGAAVYSATLRRTHTGLRRAGGRLIRRRGSSAGRSAADPRRPLPTHLDPRRPPRRWRRRSILAATAVGMFLLAMAVVTVVEVIAQQPLAALVGGAASPGATTIGTLTDRVSAGGATPRTPPPAPATPTGRAATDSAAASAPAATATSPSTGASTGVSTAPPTRSSAPTRSPGERSATPAPPRSAATTPQTTPTAAPGQPPAQATPSP